MRELTWALSFEVGMRKSSVDRPDRRARRITRGRGRPHSGSTVKTDGQVTTKPPFDSAAICGRKSIPRIGGRDQEIAAGQRIAGGGEHTSADIGVHPVVVRTPRPHRKAAIGQRGDLCIFLNIRVRG